MLKQSKHFLECAKRVVEMAIEENEEVVKFLKNILLFCPQTESKWFRNTKHTVKMAHKENEQAAITWLTKQMDEFIMRTYNFFNMNSLIFLIY